MRRSCRSGLTDFDVVVPQDWQTKAEVLAMPVWQTIHEHKCGFDPRQR